MVGESENGYRHETVAWSFATESNDTGVQGYESSRKIKNKPDLSPRGLAVAQLGNAIINLNII